MEKPRRHIFFFVKILEKQSYVDDFLSGNLYLNPLGHFKRCEDGSADNRADQHEGLSHWFQPEKVHVEINGIHLPSVDFAAPISIQMYKYNCINMLSLYAAHSGQMTDVSTESLPLLRKQLEIPSECLALGDHAVIVTSPSEFIARIKHAIQANGFGLYANLVNYVNFDSHHGGAPDKEAPFLKSDNYQHQREYRFAVDAGHVVESPLRLPVGDLRDITLACRTSEINDLLSLRLPDGTAA